MKTPLRIVVLLLTALIILLPCGCAMLNAPATIKLKDNAEVTPTPAPTEEIKTVYMAEPPQFRLGNEAGNIAAGGYTVMRQARNKGEDGQWHYDRTVYAALEDGIYRGKGYEQGTFERICTDKASCLNLWEDRLYFISELETNGKTFETITSVDLDGRNRIVHTEMLPVEDQLVIADESDRAVSCTLKNGYTDLYVGEDTMFFIADNNKPGETTLQTADGEELKVMWESGHSIYAVDIESGEKQVLVEELGNGACRMNLTGRNYFFNLYHTQVFDGGEEGAIQTRLREMFGDVKPIKLDEILPITEVKEEILGFEMEYMGVDYYIGRGVEGDNTLRIECMYTEETDPPWESLPGIAQPLITMHEFFWLDGERTDDGWKNVTLMRSHKDGGKMKHDPIYTLGDVPDGSEFSDFAISTHVSGLYLRTAQALYHVGIYVDNDLLKLCEISKE